MNQNEFRRLLEQVAKAYETTPEQLEINIRRALDQTPKAQDSPEQTPASFEEYISYLARTLPKPYLP